MNDAAIGNEPTQATELTVVDVALLLAQHLRLLLLGTLGAGLLAFGITFLIPPTYTATARLLPPGQQQNSASALLASQLGSLAGLVGGAVKTPADQYVALLKSRSVNDALVDQFKLRELYGVRYREDALRRLANESRINAGPKDGIISIEVDDTDPKRAAEMANAFVNELRNITNSLAVTEAAQRRLFFDNQLKIAKDNLTKAEIALRSSGVSEATLKTVPQSALEALARLRAQITAQEIKLSSMRTYMTDTNPEYRVAMNELAALKMELQKAEQSSGAKEAGQGADYIAKFRDFKYNEALYELMAKQFEMARIDEAREGLVIQVLDAAQPPERAARPRKGQIAIVTAIFAFVLLALFVVARDRFRIVMKDPAAAQKWAKLVSLLRIRPISRS